MEGWLQAPPERNIMGRAAWKLRYVVFGRDSSRKHPGSQGRPLSATDRHSYSYATNDHSAPTAATAQEIWNSFYLTVYKLKNDTEPLARYSIQEIASCYIGDLGMKQKKQVILPTLIIHLKSDNQQITSPRTFRRRSHDAPYVTKPAPNALFFRPAADNPNALQPWAREIQFYLNACATAQMPQNPNPSDQSYPDTPQTSSSLFFVNGEPSTALLSPSIRSKASDLSSIPSDRESISSSSLSELPSPRADVHSSEQNGRPTLHIATGSGDYDPQDYHSRLPPAIMPLKDGEEPRRETILDRYFQNYPTPQDVPASGSSIARFEALMEELENRRPAAMRKDSFVESMASFSNFEIPARIPTPTLRALEYVSTGVRHDSDNEYDQRGSNQSSRRSSFILYDESDHVPRRRASGTFDDFTHSPNRSRRNSDSSFGGGSSITGGRTNSIVGSLSGFAHDKMNSGSSTSKRHSISDFNLRLLPPHLGVTSAYHSALTAVGQGSSRIDRPGSISEFTHDFTDEATLKKLATAPNYYSRNNRPPVPPPIRREW